jgi:Holliday junction DNA helicase RuvA
VGYKVAASARTLSQLAVGQAATLAIETQVREDAISLYGFLTAAEHDWFNLLTTVQGVGAKVALSILSTLSPAELQLAIAAQDKARLTTADGVGPKLAARLLVELKDKVSHLALPTLVATGAGGTGHAMPAVSDVVLALEKLGYGRAAAMQAAAQAASELGDDAGAAMLIRHSLKNLAEAA